MEQLFATKSVIFIFLHFIDYFLYSIVLCFFFLLHVIILYIFFHFLLFISLILLPFPLSFLWHLSSPFQLPTLFYPSSVFFVSYSFLLFHPPLHVSSFFSFLLPLVSPYPCLSSSSPSPMSFCLSFPPPCPSSFSTPPSCSFSFLYPFFFLLLLALFLPHSSPSYVTADVSKVSRHVLLKGLLQKQRTFIISV